MKPQPSSPGLSVCLIVRNEAAHLPRCLASIRDIADDLVVVDTGSTDDTVAIARSFDARVFALAWPNDFSAARNFSIEQATGEWILAIDADEAIATRDHRLLRAALRRDADAMVFPQRHYTTASTVVGWRPGSGGYAEGERYPGYVDVPCGRFFRRRPWLRFRNRVHEELVSTDPERPVVWGRGEWVLHHFGKAGDATALGAKAESYLVLGLAKAAEHPDDPQAQYELGVQYLELGRPEDALPSFERVVQLMRRGSRGSGREAYNDAQLRIALCHARSGRPAAALAALAIADAELPGFSAEIAFEQGNAHRAIRDDAAAERAFRRSIERKPDFIPAYVNLALLCDQGGRGSEALALLDRAVEQAPALGEVRLQRALLRRRSGDDSGALDDLEQLGAHQGALRLRARILLQHGRVQDARACAAALADDDAESAAVRGAVAIACGEQQQAVVHLRRSLELGATYEAARNLSTALAALGDRAGALAAAADALAFAPGDAAMLERISILTPSEEPPIIGRIAVHLAAGRAALARRMIEREPPPAGLEQEWADLRSVIAWHGGAADVPSMARLQYLAARFASLRQPGVLDPRVPRA